MQESEQIDDDKYFFFAGHSHRRVKIGQTSPLIIGYAITNNKDDRPPVKHEFLYAELNKEWSDDQYLFVLGNYQYDEFMELEVYSKSQKKELPQQGKFVRENKGWIQLTRP